MWRPNGWNTHLIIFGSIKRFINPRREDWVDSLKLVEAGADAMLSSLLNSPDVIEVKKNEYNETPSMRVNGKWVFIPDEEQDEN